MRFPSLFCLSSANPLPVSFGHGGSWRSYQIFTESRNHIKFCFFSPSPKQAARWIRRHGGYHCGNDAPLTFTLLTPRGEYVMGGPDLDRWIDDVAPRSRYRLAAERICARVLAYLAPMLVRA